MRSMKWMVLIVLAMVAAGCLAKGAAHEMDGCGMTPTTLETLVPTQECDKCLDTLLPGSALVHPATKYTIWSDLPEVFCSPGVLYTTVSPLPPDPDGSPSLEMRTQEGAESFGGIDGSFDVFLFHTVYHCEDREPRRVVVYVRNEGGGEITIHPKQVIRTEGTIGRVHEMEGTLARRVMEENWDTPIFSTMISPGEGQVVAYSKRFAMPSDGPDASTNTNCFGFARAEVINPDAYQHPTKLQVYVVGIEAGPVEDMASAAEALLNQAAKSGEQYIDFTTRPSGCQVRRATGVFRSFTWQSERVDIDARLLGEEGITFPMALWDHVTQGCPGASQTVPLILHPPYNRDDTIGNYMVQCQVLLRLFNGDPGGPRTVDVRFGKKDADVGLAWRAAVRDPDTAEDFSWEALPVRLGWAGPKQDEMTRSFLGYEGGPITLAPCEVRDVYIQFMIQGNSSLPFDLKVVPAEPPREPSRALPAPRMISPVK